MYRGNYGPPAMDRGPPAMDRGPPAMGPGPRGYDEARNGSSVKKKKKGKTAASPADLLERIQKRLRSENFFDTNDSDSMSSPSSSNSRMNFNSNNQHNSFSGPGPSNSQRDMMLPKPLPHAAHSPYPSSHMHSGRDYGYGGQRGSDHHQQFHPEPHVQGGDDRRNVSSRLGPPSHGRSEMHSGRESVPFIPGHGEDGNLTRSKGYPSATSFNKPSTTDFLNESFNSDDIEPPKTDYWKYGVSESRSPSVHSKNSRTYSNASSALDSQKNRMNSPFKAEFKSGRGGPSNFFNKGSRGQKKSAYGQPYGKDRSSPYSGSDSSRSSHQKGSVNDYSFTSGRRGSSSAKGFQNSPARSRHTSPFVPNTGRTGSLTLPCGNTPSSRVADKGTNIAKSGRSENAGNSNLNAAISYSKYKWEKRLSGYEESFGTELSLSKSWKRGSEDKESTVLSSDDDSLIDLPQEALQCHVCRLQSFSNNQAYKKHLQSPHHQHMFQLLQGRNDNLEAYKRAAAKLASRALEYEGIEDVKEVQGGNGANFIRCTYCLATVLNTAIDAHNQLLHHKELVEFTRPLCCGIKFMNRRSYESHKNTLKHLAKKLTQEKEFISSVIFQIDEETRNSKSNQSTAAMENSSHNSLNIPKSTYIQKVLEKLDCDPCIQDDKSNYCLVCEVSVPEFRFTFHPSCSDHHENKHTFCAINKNRITELVEKVLSEIDQDHKSSNTGTCDRNKSGKETSSSNSAGEDNATQGPEETDDFEYDFDCIPSITDATNKTAVHTKQAVSSTSEGEKGNASKTRGKQLDITTTKTSDGGDGSEPTDMEIATPDGSGDEGQFEYDFSKPDVVVVAAAQGQASELEQDKKVSNDDDDDNEEEFDYDFDNPVLAFGKIEAVSKDKTETTSLQSQADKEVNVKSASTTISKEDNNKKTENTESYLLNKNPSKCDETPADEENDIDDEIDGFDYSFEVKSPDHILPKVEVGASTSSADKEMVTEVESAATEAQNPIKDNSRDGCNKMAVSSEVNSDEGEFEYQMQEDVQKPKTGDDKENNSSEEDEFEYQMKEDVQKPKTGDEKEKNSSEEDEFEYQMEEEENIQKPKTGDDKEKNSSEEDEFEYQMEEKNIQKLKTGDEKEKNSSEEDEFEYQMEEEENIQKPKTGDDKDKKSFEENEFEYQMEEEENIQKPKTEQKANNPSEEDEFEYQMKEAKNVQKPRTEQKENNSSEEDEFEYQMEEAKNVQKPETEQKENNSSEEDEFEYQMEEEEEDAAADDAFEYELPDDGLDDPTLSSDYKSSTKEAPEILKTCTPERASGKEENIKEIDTENFEGFDYDVKEYETEMKTVCEALGKGSDQAKEKVAKTSAGDADISFKSISTTVTNDGINSVKSMGTKLKIPSVEQDLSDSAHTDVADKQVDQYFESDNISSALDDVDASSTNTNITVATSPVKVSAMTCISPNRTPTRTSTRNVSRSPARGSSRSSATSSQTTPPSTKSAPSAANKPATSPSSNVAVSDDLVTEVSEKVTEAVETDIDGKIFDSLTIKKEPNMLSDEMQESTVKIVRSSRSKSNKVENVKSTPVKDNFHNTEEEKNLAAKHESTSRSKATTGRVRASRSTPLKATTAILMEDDVETPVTPSRSVGAKRGRAASTLAIITEAESQEREEILGTPSKRPTRSRVSKQDVKEGTKETVDVVLEVVDIEESPQKKGKGAKRHAKGWIAPSADIDDDGSETVALSCQEDVDQMKEDKEKAISPKGRRGGRARRGNSTKIAAKSVKAAVDEQDSSTGSKASGVTKREAPSESDDEGSVTRGGRPSKRGRGGSSTRPSAAPKTPATSSKKAALVAATSAAAGTPQSVKDGKQPPTPATEPRSKRRSCAPVRFE